MKRIETGVANAMLMDPRYKRGPVGLRPRMKRVDYWRCKRHARGSSLQTRTIGEYHARSSAGGSLLCRRPESVCHFQLLC